MISDFLLKFDWFPVWTLDPIQPLSTPNPADYLAINLPKFPHVLPQAPCGCLYQIQNLGYGWYVHRNPHPEYLQELWDSLCPAVSGLLAFLSCVPTCSSLLPRGSIGSNAYGFVFFRIMQSCLLCTYCNCSVLMSLFSSHFISLSSNSSSLPWLFYDHRVIARAIKHRLFFLVRWN